MKLYLIKTIEYKGEGDEVFPRIPYCSEIASTASFFLRQANARSGA